MSRKLFVVSLLSFVALWAMDLPAVFGRGEMSRQVSTPSEMQEEERGIYGWELMTPEERTEHRAKLRSLKTESEREAFRLAHHEKMKARAKEKGLELPDEPMERRKGMGRDKRMDPDDRMGSRGGMGPGSKR